MGVGWGWGALHRERLLFGTEALVPYLCSSFIDCFSSLSVLSQCVCVCACARVHPFVYLCCPEMADPVRLKGR